MATTAATAFLLDGSVIETEETKMTTTTDKPTIEEIDYDFNDGQETECSYCGGDGWGIVGTDWDSDDAINGPYNGEIEQCPNCHGSGQAKDMTFW